MEVAAQVRVAEVVSSTSHRTNHHQPGTACRGSCTLVHPQPQSSNEYNHHPWFPRNSRGIRCSCLCNMTHTLVRQFCNNHLVNPRCLRLVGLAVSTVQVGSKEDQQLRLALEHGNRLEVAQSSSKPDNPTHHQPCKQFHASCKVEHRQTQPSNLCRCRLCAPHSNLGNHGRCLGRSMEHTLGCRTGPLVAVDPPQFEHHHTAAIPETSVRSHSGMR